MKSSKVLLLILCLFVTQFINAQTINNYRDIFKYYQKFTPLMQVQAHPDGESFTLVDSLNNLVLFKNNKFSNLLSLDQLNQLLPPGLSNNQKTFPKYQWKTKDTLIMTIDTTLYIYNFKTKKIEFINNWPQSAKNVTLEPTTLQVAYTIKNNLYIADNGIQSVVASDIDTNIVYGQSVHRNEFGINNGIFWSPTGKYLAYYRMDQRKVTDYPLVDVTTRVATLKNIKYPMAGMQSHYVTLGIYDINKKSKIYMQTGDTLDHYLTSVTWHPSEKYIFIGILNRDQNHLMMNMYDVNNGTMIKTLFEETNDRYVEPQTPLYFRPNNSDQFIYFSQRDGYWHLYLYDISGKLIKQITQGKWIVNEFGGFLKGGEIVWFYGTYDSPIERHAYMVNLNNLNFKKIDKGKGTHYVVVNQNGTACIDEYSNIDTAYHVQFIDFKKNKSTTIKMLLDFFQKEILPKPDIFYLVNNNGDTLYSRLFLPLNFDSTKKYPIIVYVYGGPHAQLITDSWTGGAGTFLPYLASKGYVVFTLDNRGSANRGFEFESIIYRNLGKYEVEDQMTGISWLKQKSWVDTNRIGVHGWSYGGFMTLNLMLKHPEIFKVAVAGGAVVDWKYYEVMYGERYMDTPEQNPDGYKNTSILNYVDNVHDKILLIHGYIDDVVVPQHVLSFLKACIDKGKLVDFFVYPTHSHNVKGVDRYHLNDLIENYFNENL
ncbi:MAG: DPP IV N-terminal domain-containing protein [Bacteroidales bacterium]|jgi:dipeptidyl-peptidase-4|nr:DPP IV N-terminal domain-containing protein [Bacteroidales bacterium]MDI9575643.1 DPP IV N-terminal domain-containing protein [Bacteroidota bacterium]MDY0401648.1 DPP IV N-terminal domain-containing protein [Bacteroidales bacterium]HOB77134.1 DPP IV N-terminal domain-containing protein [Bacteroidales bacterium]HPZ60580.1 DPP IV N-terminal domain-containing protein [Bacteroidales bacterium]